MNNAIELLLRIVLVGAGATAIMDLWLLFLQRLHVPTLNMAFIGRWIGHLPAGRWFHDGIAKSAPVRRELLVGWLAHYAIGIGFAVLLVAVAGSGWLLHPTFAPAFLTGLATVAAPLLVMQPALGAGIASRRTATPLRNCVRSLLNHAVFGCGLYLAGTTLARLA